MALKIGLALGGGAARGLAHLGALEVLEKEGIKIDLIAGTSIGSLIGGIYALNPSNEETIAKIKKYITSDSFQKFQLNISKNNDNETLGYFSGFKRAVRKGLIYAISLSKNALISYDAYQAEIHSLIPKINFDNCLIPLGVTALNLIDGAEVNFTSGNLLHAIMASCAIPGMFPPIQIDDQLLTDGSWSTPIPVPLVKNMGASFIIAIDVTPKMDLNWSVSNGWDLSLRASEGSRQILRQHNLKNANAIISIDVMDIHWADFTKIDECIEAGKIQTQAILPDIKKQIFRQRCKKLFFLK